MVIPDKVKVSAMICHGINLWKWLREEDYIFYLNHDLVKAIQPPEMQNCGLRVFFKIRRNAAD